MDEENTTSFQERVTSKFRNMGNGKYGRILKMARTPTSEEYKKTILITGAGILIIGAIGFVIMWLMTYLPTYF